MKWLLIEITETVEELKAIMHSQAKAKLKERVHALYVWKAGIVKDIADLAGLLGRSESTIRLWFARYQAEGLSGLLTWNYRGGKRPALSGAVLEALRIRLQELDGFRSYGEIRDWLANEQGLEIPYKTVHQTVRYKLKAKLKVARPTHRLRAETTVVDFNRTFAPNFSFRRADKLKYVGVVTRYANSHSRDFVSLGRAFFSSF